MRKENIETVYLTNDLEEEFEVSYYTILEENGDDLYGISLEKTQKQSSIVEVEEVKGITKSKKEIEKVVDLLVKYQVTPVSLLESLDTIITAEDIKGEREV